MGGEASELIGERAREGATPEGAPESWCPGTSLRTYAVHLYALSGGKWLTYCGARQSLRDASLLESFPRRGSDGLGAGWCRTCEGAALSGRLVLAYPSPGETFHPGSPRPERAEGAPGVGEVRAEQGSVRERSAAGGPSAHGIGRSRLGAPLELTP